MTEGSEIPGRYNEDLVQILNHRFEDYDSISIADLNAGNFSMFRRLAPKIRANQVWLLVDDDEERLTYLRESLQAWAERNHWQFFPEEDEYFAIVAGRYTWRGGIKLIPKKEWFTQLNFSGIRLLVSSRFLEYQTEYWLRELLTHCSEHDTAVYFTNSYSGQFRWIPSDVKDSTILAAWHRSRRKMIGDNNSILADRAPYHLLHEASKLGYETFLNKYLKSFGKNDDGFILKQISLMESEVKAVIKEDSYKTLERWISRKRYTVSGGATRMEMGLADVLALPTKEEKPSEPVPRFE